MQNKYFIIISFLCLVTLVIAPNTSLAQNSKEEAASQKEKDENKVKWEMHKSITKIFDAKFPQKYKYKIFPFQYNNNTVAFTSEITSSLDDYDVKNKEKSILIKSLQTFGGELTYWDVKNALDREAAKYKQAAEAMDGKLLINEDVKHNGFLGKIFYIAYKSKGKKYGLRVAVYMTNYSRVEQVLVGPRSTMYSYRADDFFDSIILYDGITRKENPIGVGWVEYPSENNIFTAVLPPKNSDYTPELPKFTTTPKRGIMSFRIKDPVIEKSAYYNIYTYKSDRKFSIKQINKILFSGHIAKFVENAGANNLKTDNTILDGVTTMKTKLIITPTKSFPDITTVFFEVKFKGNILMIQEVLLSNAHANSKLNKTLFSLVKFHPEKYKAVEMPAKKEPASAAK